MGPHNAERHGVPRSPSDRRGLSNQPSEEILLPPTRTLGRALLITAAAAVLPGSGHLLLRRRIGALILGVFLLLVGGVAAYVSGTPRTDLLAYVLSGSALRWVTIGCAAAALAWVCVVVRTYWLAKPGAPGTARNLGGAVVVLLLCLAIIAPLAFGAYLANAQRSLLNTLFPTEGSAGSSALDQPRINILLVGSDAGPDRTGARTDSMGVVSVDTASGQATLFGIPRNIEYAPFPPGSAMALRFPNGFHDPRDPNSGNYLLNGVYAYGTQYPELAPQSPSNNPGLNLLYSSVAYMLGLQLDYYIEVNMQGFASIVDALGGLDVQVGPNPIPIGGIGPNGEQTRPFGYIPPGRQHLTGDQALWFARSRTYTSDFQRMGRQRCLLQDLIDQKSPTDVLKNYQAVAAATTNSLGTNIPQSRLPALVALAGKAKDLPLTSLSFDPNLPDPSERDGKFNPGHPNVAYMRQLVRQVTNPTAAQPSTQPSAPAQARAPAPTSGAASTTASPMPTPVSTSCGAAGPA